MKLVGKEIALIVFIAYGAALQAQVPQQISYQGRVSSFGTNFNGTGQFKFALINSSGSLTYWSPDGTSSAGSPPATYLSLPVTDGLFNVMLGDTRIANMTIPVSARVFTNSEVLLRVWFNDGANGFQQLAPDQRLGSVGFAMQSEKASTVMDGAIGTAQLADQAVTSAKLAPGAAGTVKQVNTGPGLTGGPITGTGTISIMNAGVANTMLANPSLTISAGSGLSGGGSVSLGATTSLAANLTHNATLAGNGGSVALGINLGNANTWTGPQTFSAGVSGNGAGLSGVNADTLAGFGYTSLPYWKLAGNGGTSAGLNFLGTTDDEPLEIKVWGLRAMRFEPNSLGMPNIVGGSSANLVGNGLAGQTIGGGTSNSIVSPVWPERSLLNTISGGGTNSIHGNSKSVYAHTIAGGLRNKITGLSACTIGGGRDNYINVDEWDSTIAGGSVNSIDSAYASIGGGTGNKIVSYMLDGGTVSGGRSNVISYSQYGFIGGGHLNLVSGGGVQGGNAVGSGVSNNAEASYAFVGGGFQNTNKSTGATISGGNANTIGPSADAATIAGGRGNIINTNSKNATLGGGYGNVISGTSSYPSESTPTNSTISGGFSNRLYTAGSVIGGGSFNHIGNMSSYHGEVGHTISGGSGNGIGWDKISHSSIGGGESNFIDSADATIAGGSGNSIPWTGPGSSGSTIGGGIGNKVSDPLGSSVIAGGRGNAVAASYGSLGGGASNQVTGSYGTVAGGDRNLAAMFAFAAGRRALASNQGSLVWADSTDADFASTANNQFSVRASGGARFFSNSGATVGVALAPGANAWSAMSDRNQKENFKTLNTVAILEKLVSMPVTEWNLKSQPQEIRHIGPMAQDFKATFEVGEDDQHISTSDADGVALAAIQGLNSKLEAQLKIRDAEIDELRNALAELKRQLNR